MLAPDIPEKVTLEYAAEAAGMLAEELAPALDLLFRADAAFRAEMLAYQSFMVKTVGRPASSFTGNYDWRSYFLSLRRNRRTPLVKRPVRYTVTDDLICADWPEYARKVVWYGRRGGKNLYTAEIKEMAADGK